MAKDIIMRLKNIIATPHPSGNRIDIQWINPNPDEFSVRVMRSESSYPISPDNGILVHDGKNLLSTENEAGEAIYVITDEKYLNGETVYYYSLFPYQGDPPDYQIDKHNRTATIATAPYNWAEQMYDLLPGIYYRYDTVLPPPDTSNLSEADKQKGQLRRFLDIPASQLDQLYSLTKAMLALHNLDKVDARLLPLLAQWIGWQLDNRQEIDVHRNEIRNAPYLYKAIGSIPALENAVKRVLGWESRTKEFVHNIFVTNRPERLNLWAQQRQGGNSDWAKPTTPLSLDFAYEGRPAVARDDKGDLWLIYHTLRNKRWNIWYKTWNRFELSQAFQIDLDNYLITKSLQQAFKAQGFALSQQATLEKTDNSTWILTDAYHQETYHISKELTKLTVARRWGPSQPLTTREGIDKHPTIAIQTDPSTQIQTIWAFWNRYDKTTQRWQIDYRTKRDSENWSSITTLRTPYTNIQPQRRSPVAVADEMAGVWLFWMEKFENHWQLKYNRHNGIDWELKVAITVPLEAGQNKPQSKDDLFVYYKPFDATSSLPPQIWLFWTQSYQNESSQQTRQQICYRFMPNILNHLVDMTDEPLTQEKFDELTSTFNRLLPKEMIRSWSIDYRNHLTLDFNQTPIEIKQKIKFVTGPIDTTEDWSTIYTLPQPPSEARENYDDCEPATLLNAAGQFELFWSSNRNGRWAIWHNSLTETPATWETTKQIATSLYSQRTPLPIALTTTDTWLIYRSNQSVDYTSGVYTATETVDFRYAGCTTADTQNVSKLSLREKFADFQTYIYDTHSNSKYQNSVGVYLTPTTKNPSLIVRNQERVRKILQEFVPIQVHTEFFIEAPLFDNELFYTYEFPDDKPPRHIEENFFDSLTIDTPHDEYAGLTEQYQDTMTNWTWMHSWSEPSSNNQTVDFTQTIISTEFRTLQLGLQAGKQSYGEHW